ncbi:MAG: hypothetical protein IJV80_03720 [Clostridia bacterium]|nr:hypothetical protein [Clostridia bacterium]
MAKKQKSGVFINIITTILILVVFIVGIAAVMSATAQQDTTQTPQNNGEIALLLDDKYTFENQSDKTFYYGKDIEVQRFSDTETLDVRVFAITDTDKAYKFKIGDSEYEWNASVAGYSTRDVTEFFDIEISAFENDVARVRIISGDALSVIKGTTGVDAEFVSANESGDLFKIVFTAGTSKIEIDCDLAEIEINVDKPTIIF